MPSRGCSEPEKDRDPRDWSDSGTRDQVCLSQRVTTSHKAVDEGKLRKQQFAQITWRFLK